MVISKNEDVSEDIAKTNNLLMAKAVAISILGLASFVIGILPVKLGKLVTIKTADKDNNLIISLLLCFGGGVLLFTTFLHLQPEVRITLTYLESQNKIPKIGHGIYFSELVFCLGFFFVYLIEEVVHIILDKKTAHHEALHRSLSLRCQKTDNLTIPRVALNKLEDNGISYISNSTKELLNPETNVTVATIENNHSHSHLHIVDHSIKNSFHSLLAIVALSFHAVFEGLAVGLENNLQQVWYLFAAIATHKLVIAFCVGVELVASKTKTALLVIYIGTFAAVTPLGIGVGIALSETEGSQENVLPVVLQGMAAGTLLYVVFFEVLARERSNNHRGIWQLLAILIGFSVMMCLQFITGHEHSHEGGSGHSHEEGKQHFH